MNWHIGLRITSMMLYTGRRSLYLAFELGRWRLWIMRWDIERAPTGRFRTRDGLMGWTWGMAR